MRNMEIYDIPCVCHFDFLKKKDMHEFNEPNISILCSSRQVFVSCKGQKDFQRNIQGNCPTNEQIDRYLHRQEIKVSIMNSTWYVTKQRQNL